MNNSSNGAVHLIDDDAAIRDSLQFLLKTIGIECITYTDASEFLEKFSGDTNACLVVDIRMPGMSGLELQAELKNKHISNPLIFITGHGEIEMAVRAMRDGAYDFLQKPLHDQEFIDCVNAGLRQASAASSRRANDKRLASNYQKLSPREKEVMLMVASGKANKVVAMDIGVSQRTVEIHRARVMEKMGARNLANLVRMKIELEDSGMLQADI